MITGDQLARMLPRASPVRLAQSFQPLTAAFTEFEINTPLRVAAFLAEIAHESCELRYLEEIWGPTPAQLRYEPPSPKAAELGNTQPGDGLRFKGRSPLQLTGRANYRRAGAALGVPLEDHPELAARPEVTFRIAGWFWHSHGLNEIADGGQLLPVSKAINLGNPASPHMPLGNAQREAYFARNRQVLGC